MSHSRNSLVRMGRRLIEKSPQKPSESSSVILLDEQSHVKKRGEKGDAMPRMLIESSPVQMTLVESTGGKYVARGEFGRVGIPTQNGRIYRKELMDREIGRLSEDINSRRVLGELDHPCLTSDDFRVLTASGWRDFCDIKVGDRVWSRKDGKACLSTVKGVVDEPYSGDAYHVKGRSLDATFTPGHRFLLVKRPDRNGKVTEEYVTVAELANNPGKYGHHAVPKTAAWDGESVDSVTIPGVDIPRSASARNDVSSGLVLDSMVYAAFMGIYLSEGSCSAETADNYDVNIHQKNEWSKKYIYDEVLSKFPSELSWRETSTGYAVSDARLYHHLKPLGNVYSKYIPEGVKALGPDCLSEVVFWFTIGDGRMVYSDSEHRLANTDGDGTAKEVIAEDLRGGNIMTFTRQDVFSVSKRLVDDLHECLLKTGRSGSVSKIDPDGDYEFAGRVIKAESKVPLYQLHISHSKNVWMDHRFISIEKVPHEGNIYCLTLDGGNFYMEKDGHSFWTGNSDGKTSLKRVSHVITGLSVQKDGLIIGEAEILDTPEGKTLKALISANVQIGVSSRGFGSTQPSDDPKVEGDVVQDDFVLKTWDFVADPAVKTAMPEIFIEDVNEQDDNAAEMFLKEFPEIAAKIQEDAASKAQEAADADLREDVRREMSEGFEKRLADTIAGMREELTESIRGELIEDPEVAGAKGVLAAIAEMVSAYNAVPGDDVVRDSLRAAELEVSEAKEDARVAMSKALEASCAVVIEQALAGHPMSDALRKLVEGMVFESVDEARDKIDAIISDAPSVVEGHVSGEEAELRESNAELRGKISLLSERVEMLNGKLLKAVEVGTEASDQLQEAREQLQEFGSKLEAVIEERNDALTEAEEADKRASLEAYKVQKVGGLSNGRQLLSVLEGATSRDAIDKLVEERRVQTVPDENMAAMRARLSRGHIATDGELNESLSKGQSPRQPRVDDFGNDLFEMRRLAGVE